MKRIDSSTAVADKFGTGKNGFTAGNVQTGVKPTALTENFCNGMQEEMLAVIEGEGLTADGNVFTQLYTAIKKAIQKNKVSKATDTGTVANTYIITLNPAIDSLTDGQEFTFIPATTNTAASTIAINGLSAIPIVGLASSALQGDEIVAGGMVKCKYNQALNSAVIISSSGAMQVSPGTKSKHAVTKSQLDSVTSAATEVLAGISRKATDSEEIAGASDVGFLTPLGLRNAINAAGSAPIFAVRAWACFKQVGTQAIYASGNILSITDVAVGRSTLTFISAMQDVDYAVAGTPSTTAGSTVGVYSTTPATAKSTTKLVGSCQIGAWDGSAALADFYDVSVMIVR